MKATLAEVTHKVGSALEKWTKPVTVGAGLVSLFWALLLLPVAKRTQSLVTWIRGDTLVYPSKATSYRPLPLNYLGTPVHSARILSVRVQNRGSAAIGSSDTLWTLLFTAPSATHLVLFDSLRIDPPPLVVVAQTAQKTNALALSFGIVDPRVSVDLKLLALNSGTDGPPLAVESTLLGLPHDVTMRAPDDRLAERYFWPWAALVLLLVSVPLLPPLVREWYHKLAWKRIVQFPLYLFLLLLGLLLPAFIWVRGLAYLVSWFY
jgi:hypothetical protein